MVITVRLIVSLSIETGGPPGAAHRMHYFNKVDS